MDAKAAVLPIPFKQCMATFAWPLGGQYSFVIVVTKTQSEKTDLPGSREKTACGRMSWKRPSSTTLEYVVNDRGQDPTRVGRGAWDGQEKKEKRSPCKKTGPREQEFITKGGARLQRKGNYGLPGGYLPWERARGRNCFCERGTEARSATQGQARRPFFCSGRLGETFLPVAAIRGPEIGPFFFFFRLLFEGGSSSQGTL